MGALVKIKNQSGAMKVLNGQFGRVQEYREGWVKVLVDGDVKKLGTNKFLLSPANVQVLASGRQVVAPYIDLATWAHLNPSERVSKIVPALKLIRDQVHEGFEASILTESGLDFLDGFIERTQYYMSQYKHYGSKAIFEELRYHTFKKIGGKTFKVNNNYTSSMTRLVEMMFLETLGFFEKRRAGTSRKEVA